MEVSKIGFKPYSYNLQKTSTEQQQGQTQRQMYQMPDYRSYISFKGGRSLDLKQTMTELLKAEECPPGVWERAQEVLTEGNPQNKTLIDIHKEVYDDLHYVRNIEELREFFPQFKDVKSALDVKPVANSFLDDVKKGKLEYFNPRNDTALDLVRLVYAEGFSRTDLLQYTNNVNISNSIKGLNIPVLNPHYAQVLKLSDKEFNERITRTIAQNKFENADRRAQQSEPVYIPSARKGHPLSDEHKAKISESLIEHYAQNPQKIAEMSERQKAYLQENPEQAELFSLVVKKTWRKSPSIIKALSKHFKKCGAEPVDEKSFTPKKLSSKQRTLMKEFWDKNPWAKQMFGENMKAAWDEVRSEDVSYHTIKLLPDEIIQMLVDRGRRQGGDYQPEDFRIEYRKYKSGAEVAKLSPETVFLTNRYIFSDKTRALSMGAVWISTIVDLRDYIEDKTKKEQPGSKKIKAYTKVADYIQNNPLAKSQKAQSAEKGKEPIAYPAVSEIYKLYQDLCILCIDCGLQDCTELMNSRLERNCQKLKNGTIIDKKFFALIFQ